MSETILFVDDEAAIRDAVQQWLQLSGFEVRLCSSADECLKGVARELPGVVISDVRMPGTDGLALLDRLQQLDRDLPVIMVTGHGDVPMAVQAMRQGAYDFIEKPFTPDACSTACAAPWRNAGWCRRTASCASRRRSRTRSNRACWASRDRWKPCAGRSWRWPVRR